MNVDDVILAIRSGHKLIVVETDEEYRFLEDIAQATNKWADIYTWTPTSALRKVTRNAAFSLDKYEGTGEDKPIVPIMGPDNEPIENAINVLKYIGSFDGSKYNLWILRNLDIGSEGEGFMNARKVKDLIPELGKNIVVVVSSSSEVAPIVSRDYVIVRYGLMNTKECRKWLDEEITGLREVSEKDPTRKVWVKGKMNALNGAYKIDYSNEELDTLASAFTGLTKQESLMALNTSLKKLGRLDHSTIASTKMTTVQKSGLVEWIEPEDMKNVGGLELIKEFLTKRKAAVNNPDALKYGLEYPKGLVLLGLPGSGI